MKHKVIPEPSRDELLQVIAKAQEDGHLPEGYVEQTLATMRGETGERARGVLNGEQKRELSEVDRERALSNLKSRFEGNTTELPGLHPDVQWAEVESALRKDPESLWSLLKLVSHPLNSVL